MFDKIVKYLIVVAFLTTSVNALGQNEWSVKGRVLSKTNTPVSGVAVSVEGVMSEPSITDSLGRYEVSCPSGAMWLLVSPIGYHNKRVFINNRKEIIIYLQNEDVLSSYMGISTVTTPMLKRNITGSVIDLNVDDITKLPFQTVDQFFQGRVSGMQVSNHSGMPGDGTYAALRGISSMNANNQPLYIIDGIPYESAGIFNSLIDGNSINPLSSLEPQDITNIVVYKDAVATTLWGLKGSNGVVIIETLKPTETKTTIDFSFRTGLSLRPEQIPVLKSDQYRTYAQEVLSTSPLREEFFIDLFPGLYDDPYLTTYNRYNNNTDWQDLVYRNGLLTDMNFSVRGGDEIAKYGLSVGFLSHEGVAENTNYTRTNVRFVGAFNITEWLRMNLSSNFNYGISNLMETGPNFQTSPVFTSLFKSPLMHPYVFDELGRELTYLDDVGDFMVSNPLAAVTGYEGKNDNYRLVSSMMFEVDINKNLKLNQLFSVNFTSFRESVFQPNAGMVDYYDGEAYNVLKNLTNNLFSFFNDTRVSYIKNFNQVHDFSASLGFRLQTNRFEEDNALTMNLDPSDEFKNLGQGNNQLKQIGGTSGFWNWLSLYSTASYVFKDTYILSAAATLDGSSQVGKDVESSIKIGNTPFSNFYSLGLGWRLSNEALLKNISWLEELKLRASFGTSGSDNIGYYNSIKYYEPVLYRNTTGAILGNIPNTTLKNELSVKRNLGLDFSVFGERLTLTADYFEQETRDMLIFEQQDPYMGYSFRPTNGGSMVNRGFELQFNYRVLKGKNYSWDLGGNVTQYENEVLSLDGGSLLLPIEGGEILTSVGNPVNSFYGYIAEGVYPTTESARAVRLVNDKGVPYSAGDIKYLDLSGPKGVPDGVINRYDKTIIGSSNPDFFGGVYSSVRYNRWSLDVMFNYTIGNEVFNFLRYQTEKMSDLSNQSTAVLNRWQTEGQITAIPRAAFNDVIGNSDFSTRWIEDGSYLKLSNLTLAYTIPQTFKLFGSDVFRNARVFVTGSNLLYISKYLGYTPEFSYGFNPLLQGVDYGLLPNVSTFIIGVKLGL